MASVTREAERLAQTTEQVSATYATELGRVLRDLERTLQTLAIDALEGSPTALGRAVRAAKLRQQIRTALTEAGYPRLAEVASSVGLDRVVAQVQRLRGAAKLAAFVTTDEARIAALKNLAKLDLLGVGDEIAQAVWRTVAQGVFSARPVGDLLADLSDALDSELSEARTLYDTTVNIFARSVEAMKAGDDPETAFLYVGPVDDKTREFCLERVGKVFTRAEIEDMDNEQLPNVFLTGGGYNCRHQFVEVSKFSETRELVGTGQRLSEVQQQLDRLDEAA